MLIGFNSGIQESKASNHSTKKNIFYLVFIYPQADTKEFEKSQTSFHSNRTDNKNGDVDGDRNNTKKVADKIPRESLFRLTLVKQSRTPKDRE